MDAGGARTRAEFSVALTEALAQCDARAHRQEMAARRCQQRRHSTSAAWVLDAVVGVLVRGTKEVDRRLTDDRDELVQLEIELAFRQGIKVIAVLLDGADMPTRQYLVESMAELARADARHVSRRRWRSDLTELIEELKTFERREQRASPLRRKPTEVVRLVTSTGLSITGSSPR